MSQIQYYKKREGMEKAGGDESPLQTFCSGMRSVAFWWDSDNEAAGFLLQGMRYKKKCQRSSAVVKERIEWPVLRWEERAEIRGTESRLSPLGVPNHTTYNSQHTHGYSHRQRHKNIYPQWAMCVIVSWLWTPLFSPPHLKSSVVDFSLLSLGV